MKWKALLVAVCMVLCMGQGCPSTMPANNSDPSPVTNIPPGVYMGTVNVDSLVDFSADAQPPRIQSFSQAWTITFAEGGSLAREDGSPVQVGDEHVVQLGTMTFKETVSSIQAGPNIFVLDLSVTLTMQMPPAAGMPTVLTLSGVGQEAYRLQADGSITLNADITLASPPVGGGLMTGYYQYSGSLSR